MTTLHRSARWARFTRMARPIIEAALPLPCVDCPGMVMPGQAWDVGHRRAHALDPTQPLTLEGVGPSHRRCNRSAGGKLGASRRAGSRGADLKLPSADSGW